MTYIHNETKRMLAESTGVIGATRSFVIIRAVSKVVFDRIESLKPWGMLLGDEKDEEQPGKLAEEVKKDQVIKRINLQD